MYKKVLSNYIYLISIINGLLIRITIEQSSLIAVKHLYSFVNCNDII